MGFLIYVCLCSVMSDFFATPWTTAHQAPLSMEFSRQGYWSGFPFPPPGNLSNTGFEPMSSSLQADSLPLHHPGRSFLIYRVQIIILPFFLFALETIYKEYSPKYLLFTHSTKAIYCISMPCTPLDTDTQSLHIF